MMPQKRPAQRLAFWVCRWNHKDIPTFISVDSPPAL